MGWSRRIADDDTALVQSYDAVVGEAAQWQVLGRWWNGRWGRLARRDIRVSTNGMIWRVEAREGTGDDPWWRRDYVSESEAQAVTVGLLRRGAAEGEWRNLTEIVEQGPDNGGR